MYVCLYFRTYFLPVCLPYYGMDYLDVLFKYSLIIQSLHIIKASKNKYDDKFRINVFTSTY